MFDINEYEVLTPNGWSDLSGITKTKSDILFSIEFTDNTILNCTAGHLLKYPNGDFLEVCHILVGDELYNGKIVKNITYIEGEFDVYDLNDVSLGNEYYTNGVVSHNCHFVKDFEAIWTSAQMTLATGGRAILLSTPNGMQGLYYQLWQQAEEGRSIEGLDKFNPISLPWYLHPERDQNWRNQQDHLLGTRMAAQECDCSWLTSGHTVVDSEAILFYEKEMVKDPLEKRGPAGDLWIWQYPNYSKTYVVTVDVARGDGEDYSAFHVIDVEAVEQVAEYKGKIDPATLGNMVIAVATEYNNALLVIDNRNIGFTTIQVAIDQGYKNLYYTYKNDPFLDQNIHLRKGYDLKDKHDMVPGYSIDVKTRPILISKLDLYFRDKAPKIYSKRFINELWVFMWIDGKPQAQKGYNDDLVMSFCMGLMVRDTSLKLRQIGIDITKTTLAHTHKSVYKPKPIGSNNWEMNIGPTGQKDSLKWLL